MSDVQTRAERASHVRWAVWMGFSSICGLFAVLRAIIEHESLVVPFLAAVACAASATWHAGEAAE